MRQEQHASIAWHEANQRYIVAKLQVLGGLLAPESQDAEAARIALEEAAAAMPAPPAIEVLAATFGLSPFERDLVAMCAGVELDSGFAGLCAAAQSALRRPQPTFSLALATLPGAHWSALGPDSPLRRFHLIEVGPGESLTRSPLRIDERVLHFLVGIVQPDERLLGLLKPVVFSSRGVPSHQRLSERLVELWKHTAVRGRVPLVELRGGDRAARRDIAAGACAALGLGLMALDAHALAARADLELVGRLLVRELMLGGRGMIIEADGFESAEPSRAEALGRLIERLPGLILVSARDRLRLGHRVTVPLEVQRPTEEERSALWREALAAARGRPGGARSPLRTRRWSSRWRPCSIWRCQRSRPPAPWPWPRARRRASSGPRSGRAAA